MLFLLTNLFLYFTFSSGYMVTNINNYKKTFMLQSRKSKYAGNANNLYDSIYNDIYDDIYDTTSSGFKEIFKPKTKVQDKYYKDINNDYYKLIIANGPAGTGKTLFPTQHAAKLLSETKDKIIVTRPLISVDEELGYLPGNINKKMDPWIIPIFDILREFFSQKDLNFFINEKRLEIVPLAFMRGRTFKDAFIVGDELQNTTIKQMLMLLTRLGENSRLVITGDTNQCDNNENGLLDLLNRINYKYDRDNDNNIEDEFISMVKLEKSDIQRSPIVDVILRIYE